MRSDQFPNLGSAYQTRQQLPCQNTTESISTYLQYDFLHFKNFKFLYGTEDANLNCY
jgi:hypothetical protein